MHMLLVYLLFFPAILFYFTYYSHFYSFKFFILIYSPRSKNWQNQITNLHTQFHCIHWLLYYSIVMTMLCWKLLYSIIHHKLLAVVWSSGADLGFSQGGGHTGMRSDCECAKYTLRSAKHELSRGVWGHAPPGKFSKLLVWNMPFISNFTIYFTEHENRLKLSWL